MSSSQLVSIGEAAKALGVSADTIRRLAKNGEVKTIRLARRVLVPESEITRISENGVGRYARQPVR